MLLVAIQPARASPLAHYAPAITIGCFVVRFVNLRPQSAATPRVQGDCKGDVARSHALRVFKVLEQQRGANKTD